MVEQIYALYQLITFKVAYQTCFTDQQLQILILHILSMLASKCLSISLAPHNEYGSLAPFRNHAYCLVFASRAELLDLNRLFHQIIYL